MLLKAELPFHGDKLLVMVITFYFSPNSWFLYYFDQINLKWNKGCVRNKLWDHTQLNHLVIVIISIWPQTGWH